MKESGAVSSSADEAEQADGAIEVDDSAGADGSTDGDDYSGDDAVSELQRELTTERDKHLRLAAEFDNFRRRNLKEKMEAELSWARSYSQRSLNQVMEKLLNFCWN